MYNDLTSLKKITTKYEQWNINGKHCWNILYKLLNNKNVKKLFFQEIKTFYKNYKLGVNTYFNIKLRQKSQLCAVLKQCF